MVNEHSEREPEKSASLLGLILEADENLSRAISVCAHHGSPLGSLRPLLKALEWSFHGVPWLIGAFIAICIAKDEHCIVTSVNIMAARDEFAEGAAAITGVVALLLDLIVVVLFKATIRRRRPAANRDDMVATVSVDRFSFPSGHTTRAVLMACILCSRIFRDSGAASTLVGCWAAATAVSRCMLGRHYVLDVSAGIAIGLVVFAAFVHIMWLPADVCLTIAGRARWTVGLS